MTELVRTVLMLVLAGGAVTVLGGWAAWWQDEDRRLRRLIHRALQGEPDGAIVARGRNAAAGFRLETGQIVVMSNGGARALLYRLEALEGAELIVDGVVVSRMFRGEGRRPLDQITGAPQRVTVRMVFNDARNPDFDLDLWMIEDLKRRNAPIPADTIHEGRTWLARIDALLRRGPAVAQKPVGDQAAPAPPQPGPPMFQHLDDEDDDGPPPWDEEDDER